MNVMSPISTTRFSDPHRNCCPSFHPHPHHPPSLQHAHLPLHHQVYQPPSSRGAGAESQSLNRLLERTSGSRFPLGADEIGCRWFHLTARFRHPPFEATNKKALPSSLRLHADGNTLTNEFWEAVDEKTLQKTSGNDGEMMRGLISTDYAMLHRRRPGDEFGRDGKHFFSNFFFEF